MNIREIENLLGTDAKSLLGHEARIPKSRLHLPGPDFVDRVWALSDRSPNVLRNMQLLFNTGRLSGSGYVSILPVDQGIEHSAGASFAPNPDYFDPEHICKLGLEGIVSKRRDSGYRSGRSPHWIKSKTAVKRESEEDWGRWPSTKSRHSSP